MRRLRMTLCLVSLGLAIGGAAPALAHEHVVPNPSHVQEIAHSQNHGPDSGTPGKAGTDDQNPTID